MKAGQGARHRRRLRPRGTHAWHLRGGRGATRSARQFGRHLSAGAPSRQRFADQRGRIAERLLATKHAGGVESRIERSRRLTEDRSRRRNADFHSATQAR